MKKTLTVNLGGIVFHIDEDAYQLLDNYLTSLREHFRKEEGSEEIMNDFELRISELLNERIRLGYNVITIEQVDEVINRMGSLEEIFGESESEAKEEWKEEYKVRVENTATKRRLFRNPDDRILGGVAGGLAAYLGWDPTPLRLALVLLMFFYFVTIPIYLIIWLVVPMARTAAERLQMKGESVTIENIGKTVTDGFEKVTHNVNEYVASGKPRTTLQKLGDALVVIIGAIIKVFAIILCIILFPPLLVALFVMLVVLFAVVAALFGGGFGLLYGLMPFADWDMLSVYPEGGILLSAICLILAIGIPVVALIYVVCVKLFKWKPMGTGARWVLIVLWILSFIVVAVMGVRYGFPLWDDMHGWHWNTFLPIHHVRW